MHQASSDTIIGYDLDTITGQGGWASIIPDSGTIPPGNSTAIEVILDARSMYQVGDFTADLYFSGNYVNDVPLMPLTMTLSCPTCGILNGHVTDALTGLSLAADIQISGPNEFDVDISGENYRLEVQPSNYEFTLLADGYLTATETIEAIEGVTTTTDFALTPAVAILDHSPDIFEVSVPLGVTTTRYLLIENNGTVPFDFLLSDYEAGTPDKETTITSCTPDSFGYSCVDSNEVDGPTYDWQDISFTGTSVILDDDDYFFPINLPFNFNFYGADYSGIAVASNGTVYFEDANLGLLNTTIPASNIYDVHTYIAAYWDDLDPSSGGSIFYEIIGDAPKRSLIIQWDQVPRFGTSDTVTIQVKLQEDSNNILVQYLDPSDQAGIGATEGIQGDVSTGVLYGFDAAVLAPELAICYVYPEALDRNCSGAVDAEWVREVPDYGTVLPGQSMEISIVFDATAIGIKGTFTASLHFNGSFDNPVNPATLIMHVEDPYRSFLPLLLDETDTEGIQRDPANSAYPLPAVGIVILPSLLVLGAIQHRQRRWKQH
jgi:hypothetical protein